MISRQSTYILFWIGIFNHHYNLFIKYQSRLAMTKVNRPYLCWPIPGLVGYGPTSAVKVRIVQVGFTIQPSPLVPLAQV